jgi:ribosome-associated protein
VPGRATDPAGSREIALTAAKAAAAKQAADVTILDVHGLIVITDFFVICSGQTERQVKTIVEEIEKAVRDLG